MLSIFICEDCEEQLHSLRKQIESILLIEHLDMKVVAATKDPEEILGQMEMHSLPGIYFFDIDLNADMDGLMLAREVRRRDPRGFIIFITVHSEMFRLTFSYKTEAMDFIEKGEELFERIRSCLLTANERHHAKDANTSLPRFVIQTRDRVISEEFDRIIFFETAYDNHKVTLHSEDRQFVFRATMKEVEAKLDARFFRCDKSKVINKDKIKEIDKRRKLIYMTDGTTCPISIRNLRKLVRNVTIS